MTDQEAQQEGGLSLLTFLYKQKSHGFCLNLQVFLGKVLKSVIAALSKQFDKKSELQPLWGLK